MADNLDIDQPIVMIDPITDEFKATPYFENYLFKIIETLGGEGSTVISDIISITIEADKIDYMFGLVKSLKKQIDEINNTIDSPILDSKIKTMQTKLGELETHFDNHQLNSAVKQIQVDTSGFIGKVKSANYTAETKDWIEARNKAVIKLPANPLVNDQIIVSNGDGSLIKIDGNGNKVKYTITDTLINIRNQGTSLHFQLFEDQSIKYWRIR